MICETADKVDVYLNNNNNLDEILDGFSNDGWRE